MSANDIMRAYSDGLLAEDEAYGKLCELGLSEADACSYMDDWDDD